MMIPAVGAQAATSKELNGLKKACEQFEAIFAKQLLGEMRKGMQDQLSKTPGGEIYKDMMDQAIADSMAHQGSLGIGKILFNQFSKALAPQNPTTTDTTKTSK